MRIKSGSGLVLIQFVVLSSLVGICANSQGYLPWPDWTNVTPIVVDTRGDESLDYDIISCRATFDDDYIYLNIRVLGTLQPESIYIWIDADTSSETGNKSGILGQHGVGADYYMHPTDGKSAIAYLFKWSGSAWERSKPLDFNRDGSSVSIAVARVDLGNPTKINLLFVTEKGTDYAPDVGFSSLNVPPVGGAQPEPNPFIVYAPYIIAIAIVIAVVVAFFVYRSRREGLF